MLWHCPVITMQSCNQEISCTTVPIHEAIKNCFRANTVWLTYYTATTYIKLANISSLYEVTAWIMRYVRLENTKTEKHFIFSLVKHSLGFTFIVFLK